MNVFIIGTPLETAKALDKKRLNKQKHLLVMGNMRFKVGDRVRIKSIDWYYENINEIDEIPCGSTVFIPNMVQYISAIVTISAAFPSLGIYHIKEDGGMFNWTDEMIEGLAEEDFIDIDEFEDDNEIIDIIDEYVYRLKDNECQIDLPEGYQFTDEYGNVINATKIVLEKKKKEYPKTYEECCKVFGLNHYLGISWNSYDVYSGAIDSLSEQIEDIAKKLEVLSKLLLCRDAYWKIAGEELDLGKPWKPDWSKGACYTICCNTNQIVIGTDKFRNSILAFPTKEMRDAFYENFKEDIEFCKELL